MGNKEKPYSHTEAADALQKARDLNGLPLGDTAKLRQSLVNAFTDNEGKADFGKITLLGLAGTVGGLFGYGIIGTGGVIGAVASVVGLVMGAGIMSAFSEQILHFLRGGKSTPRPPALESRLMPAANEKTLETLSVPLPELPSLGQAKTQVSYPAYAPDTSLRVPLKGQLAEIERALAPLREVAETGWPQPNEHMSKERAELNQELRTLIGRIEQDALAEESNRRYLRDAMAKNLPAISDKTKDYLGKLGGGSEALLPRIELSDIPGAQGSLPPALEAYGKNALKYLIAANQTGELQQKSARDAYAMAITGFDVASLTPEQNQAAEQSWKLLSITNKKWLVGTFLKHVARGTQGLNVDLRDYWREDYDNYLGVRVSNLEGAKKWLASLIPFGDPSLRDQFENARAQAFEAVRQGGTPDWLKVAGLLERRIGEAESLLKNNQPGPDANTIRIMKVMALTYRGEAHYDALDAYEKGEYRQQLEKLDEFALTRLPAYRAQVESLRDRMNALEQTGLLLVDTPVKDKQQHLSVQDRRGGTPRALEFELAFADDAATQLSAITLTEGGNRQTITFEQPVPMPADLRGKAAALLNLIDGAFKASAPSAAIDSPELKSLIGAPNPNIKLDSRQGMQTPSVALSGGSESQKQPGV